MKIFARMDAKGVQCALFGMRTERDKKRERSRVRQREPIEAGSRAAADEQLTMIASGAKEMSVSSKGIVSHSSSTDAA